MYKFPDEINRRTTKIPPKEDDLKILYLLPHQYFLEQLLKLNRRQLILKTVMSNPLLQDFFKKLFQGWSSDRTFVDKNKAICFSLEEVSSEIKLNNS